MKALVIGGTGQVGAELAGRVPHGWDVLVTRRSVDNSIGHAPNLRLDVTDADAISRVISDNAPDVVINATAYTAVDRAETERDDAFKVNAEAVAAMATAAEAIGARFVHYSTDYVFDGAAHVPYREDAPTSPLGVYGESKLAGEHAVRAACSRHLILRTAWVYAPHGHNFMRTMLRLAAERDELRVVDDQIGCPTPASWIADATYALLRDVAANGTVNVVTAGQTTWCGFARSIFEIASELGVVAVAPRVLPIPSSAYPTPARRPSYSVLDTSRLRAFGVTPPQWRVALEAELRRIAAADPNVR